MYLLFAQLLLFLSILFLLKSVFLLKSQGSLLCSADLSTTNFNVRARFFFLCPPKISLSCVSPPAAGSYVALTVLGRPPGVPQIPLEEEEDSDVEKREEEEQEEGAQVSSSCSPLARPASERCPSESSAAASLADGVRDKESS